MSFTFNGINSESMGLFVEKYPERPFPSRKQSTYDIHGRSGDIIVDENSFTNVTQTYEVYIHGGSVGFQAKASKIAGWLLNVDGYANLVDSYDPTVYRKARFTGGVSFLNSLNKFGKATISFDCCPQRYPVIEEKMTGFLGDTFTFPASDMMNGLPLITITGWVANDTTGTVVTDDLSITLPTLGANADIYIDFETHLVYDNSGNIINATITGTWNALGDGSAIVTSKTAGTATPTITVDTRRWYI